MAVTQARHAVVHRDALVGPPELLQQAIDDDARALGRRGLDGLLEALAEEDGAPLEILREAAALLGDLEIGRAPEDGERRQPEGNDQPDGDLHASDAHRDERRQVRDELLRGRDVGEPVLSPRGRRAAPDLDRDRLALERLERMLVGPVVTHVHGHDRPRGQALDRFANPQGATALVPSHLGQDLDHLAAVEDLQPVAALLDRARQLRLDLAHPLGGDVAVVDGQAQSLGLHAHALDATASAG